MTGTAVWLFGLGARISLNGQSGTLVLFDVASQRWQVKLETGMVISVRPSNLTRDESLIAGTRETNMREASTGNRGVQDSADAIRITAQLLSGHMFEVVMPSLCSVSDLCSTIAGELGLAWSQICLQLVSPGADLSSGSVTLLEAGLHSGDEMIVIRTRSLVGRWKGFGAFRDVWLDFNSSCDPETFNVDFESHGENRHYGDAWGWGWLGTIPAASVIEAFSFDFTSTTAPTILGLRGTLTSISGCLSADGRAITGEVKVGSLVNPLVLKKCDILQKCNCLACSED
ncbi:unnamed protein product [Polarella glacialis]|nr:unnamed protein product [Polarella glacialis]CAE8705194.1 unnamed protein product [Polarella glacialis]